MGNRTDQSIVDLLQDVVGAVVARHGLELVELAHHKAGRYQTLRVFVDKAGGVTIAECAAVSRRLSADLDEQDLIQGRYTLEVSSPGFDRPLRTEADFRRKIGRRVRLQFDGEDGKRGKMEGTIDRVDADGVTIAERQFAWSQNIEGKLTV